MKTAAILSFLLLSLGAGAQKQVSTNSQTWLGLIQQVRFSNRWGLSADLHFRTADNFVQGKNIVLGRIGATYYPGDRTQVSAGYAHFHYYPGENHPQDARPEQRLWQQVLWTTHASRLRVQNRLRLEERWRKHVDSRGGITDDYDFNWRTRMQLQLLYPLGNKPFGPGSLALMAADEAMLNLGREIQYNIFDQNRLIAGVQLQVNKNDFLQIGYMHIFQQQASGNKYRQSHVARIYYTRNIDLRRQRTVAVTL
ncbi:Protein of unknown function [Cnuella takakiae]|uniref:DUF2490 domain-containing protein n=1 Tax=Cnuella takakiae TaxID=1302690 RepID=A0A1M5G537_9BACT|nr:DUF2490 domain-containing protein [Cnuella takakiae]OLY92326.1 hypothetical protein BUE76_10790 [Cnuella takakiae]SHF98532.1 Protein of unknown function [Cnuella takakiae]